MHLEPYKHAGHATETPPWTLDGLDRRDGRAARPSFRAHGPLTRAEVSERTGWARMTVNGRIDRLVEVGLLEAGRPRVDQSWPAGGALPLQPRPRPAARSRTSVRPACGWRCCDLRRHRPAARRGGHRHRGRPGRCARGRCRTQVRRDAGRRDGHRLAIWGVGISLPGPVEFATGTRGRAADHDRLERDPRPGAARRALRPHGLRGQRRQRDGARRAAHLLSRGRRPALREDRHRGRRRHHRRTVHVLRGAQGAAGDIGHTWADVGPTPARDGRCAGAASRAASRRTPVAGRSCATSQRPASRSRPSTRSSSASRFGDPLATSLLRDAGRVIGSSPRARRQPAEPVGHRGRRPAGGRRGAPDVRASASASTPRSLPLATRDLQIVRSRLDGDAGVTGLSRGLADAVLSPENLTGQAAGRAVNA